MFKNEEQEFQRKRIKTCKSNTNTITIKKSKTEAIKAREAKRLQRIDESPEIKEERIEKAQDKRSRVSETTNYEILNSLNFEEVNTDSQWSESDQNEELFSFYIFDVFNEIEITGDGNWMFGALSLGAFGNEKYHLMVRPIICDYIDAHRSIFNDFIIGGISTYLREMRKLKWWRGNIELVIFSELFEFNISVFDIIKDLIPRYSYEYSRSSETISLIYRNEEHYNLLMRKSKISIDKGVQNVSKQDIKNRGVWKVI